MKYESHRTCKYGHNYSIKLKQCQICKNERSKAWRSVNKEKVIQYQKQYRTTNKDKLKKHYATNSPKAKATALKWVIANRDRLNRKRRDYYARNKEKCIAISGRCIAKRKATDPIYKLNLRMRSLISTSFRKKGYTKSSKAYELIGCSYEQLHEHLQQTAIKNYGFYDPNTNYHVDHIIPCSCAKNEKDLSALHHYTNLQFLTPADNISKSNKLDWTINSSKVLVDGGVDVVSHKKGESQ